MRGHAPIEFFPAPDSRRSQHVESCTRCHAALNGTITKLKLGYQAGLLDVRIRHDDHAASLSLRLLPAGDLIQVNR